MVRKRIPSCCCQVTKGIDTIRSGQWFEHSFIQLEPAGLEQLAKLNISLCLSLLAKAERSDKNVTDIFMNQSGLKEPGFENRRTFSKKAREIFTQSNACLSANYQIDVD